MYSSNAFQNISHHFDIRRHEQQIIDHSFLEKIKIIFTLVTFVVKIIYMK